ncbi:glutaminyl-peptide cyclotransferase isoform X2 [Drosophila rhopaloa]|uniref:glutaminyl-peptide cyclotransferase n=1 Tax=Drosophila rhopaloa TaxID=1041015 RepID=A0A6P4ETB7_DRORH|nr:glutaminyl-peptide cyclotransferase isoform X2 [Drosophila rhopaloa]
MLATEAVSCAILLSLAKTMGMFFIKTFSENIDMGLALIFFDGHYSLSADPLDEIRFIGAKEFMESEIIPLENMVVAVTLSYIGAPNQTFASYFEVTNDLHNLAADIELELRKSGQLTNSHVLFKKKKQYDKDLLDDHSLLNELGVPVMHVAPQEYPKVLHTAADNTENLHWPTIRNMIQILVRFVHDFLETWATNVNLKNVFVSDSLED